MGSRLRRRRLDVDDAPVKLRAAAALLHDGRGRSRSSMRGPDYLVELNDAARALSEVLDVYYVAGAKMIPIAREVLARGTLQDGGNILRAADGAVYRRLVVRRGQAIAALTILARRPAES